MLTFTVHKVIFWTLAISNSGKNSTTKGTLIYSRLHAGATAVVQLFLLVFTRAILLSITTKSSSAKLYFFFDLAPYCHKKSLESICFGYSRHFLWGVRYHFIVWPNLKLAAVETVLKAKLESSSCIHEVFKVQGCFQWHFSKIITALKTHMTCYNLKLKPKPNFEVV